MSTTIIHREFIGECDQGASWFEHYEFNVEMRSMSCLWNRLIRYVCKFSRLNAYPVFVSNRPQKLQNGKLLRTTAFWCSHRHWVAWNNNIISSCLGWEPSNTWSSGIYLESEIDIEGVLWQRYRIVVHRGYASYLQGTKTNITSIERIQVFEIHIIYICFFLSSSCLGSYSPRHRLLRWTDGSSQNGFSFRPASVPEWSRTKVLVNLALVNLVRESRCTNEL